MAQLLRLYPGSPQRASSLGWLSSSFAAASGRRISIARYRKRGLSSMSNILNVSNIARNGVLNKSKTQYFCYFFYKKKGLTFRIGVCDEIENYILTSLMSDINGARLKVT